MLEGVPGVVAEERRGEAASEMLDPEALYALEPDVPDLHGTVLVQALGGFIDAGAAGRLAREHMLSTLEHRVVARFDVDQLLDYRARRPTMVFVQDHWEHFEQPELALHLVYDAAGTPFLLLAGPEPDYQWERFVAAVRGLVHDLGVRLTVGFNAIPMAVPHTRPVGVTAHATRPELVASYQPWVHTVQVPASAGHLLEYRLGQAGLDAIGFAVHVPHYVAQMDYPAATQVLLDCVSRAGGLTLPTEALQAGAASTLADIEEQVSQSAEVTAVVRALEGQYDAYVGARGREQLLAPDASLPSADELGAELERFLAEQTRPGDGPGG
jgi:predicted ATP-grasp superfamily ATP-dependent carboligase